MSETRKKREEARFFFHALERCVHTTPDFDYYLSAFISAARSVLCVMRSEYESNSNWRVWYDSNNPSPAELAILKGTNALRVRAVKRQTPTTSTLLSLILEGPG